MFSTSQTGVTTTFEYDAFEREVSQTDGRGNTTRTVYDSLGRVASTIDALGYATAYGYDALGRQVSVTDPLGHAVVNAYDAEGRVVAQRGATYPVDYAYDEFGDRTSMTTYRDESLAEGDTTRWLYDEASGCMTNKVYADGKGPTYAYTPDGRLATRTWARGIVTTYSYDASGALTNTVYSDGTPTVSLAYDRAGRQVEARDAAGTTTFAYDEFGSLTNETVVGVAGTNTIERFYDSLGRDLGYALNGVRQSTLAYDAATSRLATMLVPEAQSNNQTNQTIKQFSWSYLPGSDLKSSLAYPNGLTASWTYGNRGELLEVNNASPTGTISRYVYTYDAAGRRIGCAKSGSAFTTPDTNSYLYNTRSELTNAIAAVDSAYRYSYDFDDIGNRNTSSERGTNATYTANNLNQYMSVDAFVPQYDADGNQTLVKTTTGTWQVSYNGENRPILWTQGTNTISMSFDRMGRRVTKNNQRFIYNGYLQIANFHSTTTTADYNYFVWDCTENVATRPLVWQRGNSVAYYTHDGNKNVSEVIDSNTDVAAHYEYAPFGALMVSRGASAEANPFRFSSEYAEDDTATVYYNYRHYEPVMGRWMQRDPLYELDNAVLLFVRNFPVGNIDKLGLTPYSVWNTRGASISDIDETARAALKAAVSAMVDPKNFQVSGGVRDKVEFYGRICFVPQSKKVVFTGPVSGTEGGRFAAVRRERGGVYVLCSYPKTDPRVACPKGTCTVAYYHTHPSSPNFSRNDRVYIQGGRVAYYMSTGDVLKRISPRRTREGQSLKGGELRISGGTGSSTEYALMPEEVVLEMSKGQE